MKSISVIFLLIINFGVFAQKTKNIRIDPLSAKGAIVSDIFDEVEFIPLETTQRSKFSTIDQLEVTSKYFIILDMQTNSVLIFNRDGKFHNKIMGEDLGYKGERTIPFFYLNRQDTLLYFQSLSEKNKLIKIDLNGEILDKRVDSFDSFSDLFFLPNNLIANFSYRADKRYPSKINHELSLTKDNAIAKGYFPYDMKNESLISKDVIQNGHNTLYYQGNDSVAFFLRPYDYNIYRITEHGLSIPFNFILPMQLALTANFRSDTAMTGKRLNFIKNNPKILYNISHTYNLGTNLFVKLNSYGFDSSFPLVYNLKSGNLFDIRKISPDEKSSFLAITDSPLGSVNFSDKNFLNTDGKYLYTFYSALRLFNQKVLLESKKPKYSKILANYFKIGKKEDNPILIQLKPKNSF